MAYPYAPRASRVISTRGIAVRPLARVRWDPVMVAKFVEVAPTEAFVVAAQEAAALAAAHISKSTAKGRWGRGDLARDVRKPEYIGPRTAFLGSNMIYARVQDQGATIIPKNAPHLVLQARKRMPGSGRFILKNPRVGTRVFAIVDKVVIPAKHFTEVGKRAFSPLYIAALKRFMPGPP